MSNSSQVLLITGCDSGIGLQLAKWGVEWGYHVIAGCLDLTSKGSNVLRSLSITVVKLDVCRREMIRNLSDEIRKLQQEGKILWCLVNNAGVMTYAKTEWLTWDLVEAQIVVNLSGTIHMTHSMLPFLRQAKGRVINVSSPQGLVSSSYMSVYCASKWGIEAFSRALRREVSAEEVKVIIVRPCNFPHKTQILKQNSKHLEKMKQEMSPETLQNYGEELEILRSTFETAFTDTANPAESINDPYLRQCFRSAIESSSPARAYTAAPIIVRTLLAVLSVLPDSIMDILARWDVHTTIINWAKLD